MNEDTGSRKFLLKHPFKLIPIDYPDHVYKIYDYNTDKLLLESKEERARKKKSFSVVWHIRVRGVKGDEFVRVDKIIRLRILFSPGVFKYAAYDANNEFLGKFNPGAFLHYGSTLKVLSPANIPMLRVKRKRLFGFEWRFFVGRSQIASLLRLKGGVSNILKRDANEYLLEIFDFADWNISIIQLIFAVIVACRHGFNPYAFGRL